MGKIFFKLENILLKNLTCSPPGDWDAGASGEGGWEDAWEGGGRGGVLSLEDDRGLSVHVHQQQQTKGAESQKSKNSFTLKVKVLKVLRTSFQRWPPWPPWWTRWPRRARARPPRPRYWRRARRSWRRVRPPRTCSGTTWGSRRTAPPARTAGPVDTTASRSSSRKVGQLGHWRRAFINYVVGWWYGSVKISS